MKKIFFVMAVLLSTSTFAQDVKAVKKAFDAKELDKAQQAIDALLAKDDKKPENWYWKHKVYNAISESEQFKALVPNAVNTGFEALKKYLILDPKQQSMVLDGEIDFGNKLLNNYRSKFITLGSANMEAKNHSDAFTNLKSALHVFEIMNKQKIVPYTLDTLITFFTGYEAMNAKNDIEAEIYYKKLADANAFGTDFQIAYGWLANYYFETKNDQANGNIYVEKGLKLYPNDEYLKSLKTNAIQKSGDSKAIFANFEALIAMPNASYSDYINYAANLYDYLFLDSIEKEDYTEKLAKFDIIISKALELKPNAAEPNYLKGFRHTNVASKIESQVKKLKNKTTPADVTMKTKLNAEKNAQVELALKNLELASILYRSKKDKIKPNEKDNYKITLQTLINLYNYKNDKVKAKIYQDELKAL